MDIGMLWFDNDPKRMLEDKVSRAAEHYRRKYGAEPTRVYLNLEQAELSKALATPGYLAGLRVYSSRTVLPNHFWIGVAEPEPA